MKRNLIKGLIICAFATSLVGVGTTLNSKTANASTIKEGVVTASLLNVRSSDSIHSNIIGGLSRNTKVNIINIGDKWDKIRFGNKEGYVYNAYISHMYEGTQQGHVVNISSSLRVRSGASTSTATKGFLRNGAKLDIVGKSGAWYEIKYDGGYGFVHGDYVSVSSASKPAEKPSKPAEKPTEQPSKPVEVSRIEKAKKVAKDYIGSKNVGVYCTDLTTGESFGINENKIYYSASTGKLPGILYTQKKLNEGAISTNTKYAYHDYVNDIPGAMIRGGTGVLQNNIHDGKEVSVGTLLKDTCSYSDNLASNMLGYYVCDKNAGAFKEYTSNIIGRHIGTFAKEFSAKETALLMKEIYNQGGQAIENLKNTSWDKVKIPKYLPVSVAHKIGINGSYNHDVAIVYGNHPYVISVMSNGASDEFIAQLSKKIYDELN